MPYKSKEDRRARYAERMLDPEYRAKRNAKSREGDKKRREARPDGEKYPWHAKHALELKKYAQEYRATNPNYEKDRFAREMKKYGTTVEWYVNRLMEQNGVCALCNHLSHHHGTIQRLQVDHNHACCDLHTKSCGKCLRGLLCSECNLKLYRWESIAPELSTYVPIENSWLYRAVIYLDSYNLTRTQETQK